MNRLSRQTKSPEIREICAHLTPDEREQFLQEAKRRGTEAGCWLVGPWVIMLTIFEFSWRIGLILLPLYAGYDFVLGRSRRQVMDRRLKDLYCGTEYAKIRGYTPDRLKF